MSQMNKIKAIIPREILSRFGLQAIMATTALVLAASAAVVLMLRQESNQVPATCPGIESDAAGTSSACNGCPNKSICASQKDAPEDPTAGIVAEQLREIRNIIVVMSGKGGVGKSTVSTNIAYELAKLGYDVGLLDIDICGPSIPRMTGTENADVRSYANGWCPVDVSDRLSLMSVGYLLSDRDDAVIWRGPRKSGMIKQFLTDVAWGRRDFLVIDTPPGTSDEHLAIVGYLKKCKSVSSLIVTSPQEVCINDVKKEINFCRLASIPILGVVENMGASMFSEANPGGVERMCSRMDVSLLETFPLDSEFCISAENGKALDPDHVTARYVSSLVQKLLVLVNRI